MATRCSPHQGMVIVCQSSRSENRSCMKLPHELHGHQVSVVFIDQAVPPASSLDHFPTAWWLDEVGCQNDIQSSLSNVVQGIENIGRGTVKV